jgi:hypothetical protein
MAGLKLYTSRLSRFVYYYDEFLLPYKAGYPPA